MPTPLEEQKLELEGQKLKLEVEAGTERRELEKQKLELEIAALRRGHWTIATGICSIIMSLVVAGVTGYVSFQIGKFGERQHDSDSIAKLLQDLGSPSVATRAASVVGLRKYVMADDAVSSAQVATLLVTQLTSEEDQRVQRELNDVLTDAGPRVVGELIRSNRRAHEDFDVEARTIVASEIPSVSKYISGTAYSRGEAMKEDARSIYISLIEPVVRSVSQAYPLTEADRRIISRMPVIDDKTPTLVDLIRLTAAGKDRSYGLAQSTGQRTRPTPQELLQALARVKLQTRTLIATSSILGHIFDENRQDTMGPDLQSIVLFTFDISGRSLNNIDFRNAVLMGEARNAHLSHSGFQNADLSMLDVSSSDLSFANLESALLPTSIHDSELKGANWWWSSNVQDNPVGGCLSTSSLNAIYATRLPNNSWVEAGAEVDCRSGQDEGCFAPSGGFQAGNRPKPVDRFEVTFCPRVENLKAEGNLLEKSFPQQRNEDFTDPQPVPEPSPLVVPG
ncbi:pentapeptide repeat-containing protein [Paraburkholderia flagellata]|uniref:pentapeptide repeat-containing protein n=1 Tax=Paraburkholderia flagellata TaxID=2883241 RepID=UPI001F354590|nr:hypothetical protein [Paraburkholderia flagellata]